MPMHSEKQVQVEALLFDKAFIKILIKYSNYSNVFLVKNIVELSENTGINEYTIKLEKSKQSSFRSIYSLRLVELKTLKIYIKSNLANSFIQSFKYFAKAPILFDRKPDRNLRFYVDYWGLDNIIIKNQYPLLLISELLDWLG